MNGPRMASLASAALLLCLSSCAAFQRATPPAPKSTAQAIVLAQATLTVANNTLASLVRGRQVSVTAAMQYRERLTTAYEALTQAESLLTTMPQDADAQVERALLIINTIQAELAAFAKREEA